MLELRLLNLTASLVVNACAFGDDEELRNVVRESYPKPIRVNAANSMRTMSLFRALNGEEDVAPTRVSGSSETQDAYNAIQELTNRKHRQINEAIVKVLTDQLGFKLPNLHFEYLPLEDRGLRADVWFERSERPEVLEFTHLRPTEAGEAYIASYILNKVQDYARDYQLI